MSGMAPANRVELARFQRLIVKHPNGCWLFMGEQSTVDGYGRFRASPGQPRLMAHVWAYQTYKGQIPDGMQVGHLCHDDAVADGTCAGGPSCPHRRCTNPAHLGLQTPSENTLVQNHHARNRTECPKGHLYDVENTLVGADGKRRCRACRRASRLRSSNKE